MHNLLLLAGDLHGGGSLISMLEKNEEEKKIMEGPPQDLLTDAGCKEGGGDGKHGRRTPAPALHHCFVYENLVLGSGFRE